SFGARRVVVAWATRCATRRDRTGRRPWRGSASGRGLHRRAGVRVLSALLAAEGDGVDRPNPVRLIGRAVEVPGATDMRQVQSVRIPRPWAPGQSPSKAHRKAGGARPSLSAGGSAPSSPVAFHALAMGVWRELIHSLLNASFKSLG